MELNGDINFDELMKAANGEAEAMKKISEAVLGAQAKRDETQERIADALEDLVAIFHDMAEKGSYDTPVWVRDWAS